MKSNKLLELVGRAYDNIEIALWAILFAFVIYFVAFVFPRMPAIRAQNQKARAEQIAAEDALYCKRLDIKAGTERFSQCLLILGDFRVKVQTRIYNEIYF